MFSTILEPKYTRVTVLLIHARENKYKNIERIMSCGTVIVSSREKLTNRVVSCSFDYLV